MDSIIQQFLQQLTAIYMAIRKDREIQEDSIMWTKLNVQGILIMSQDISNQRAWFKTAQCKSKTQTRT